MNRLHHGYGNLFRLCRLVAVLLTLASATQVRAGFIGPYDLSQFTLANVSADGGPYIPDGFAASGDGGQTLILTGGNTGSGLGGWTDFVVVAPESGVVGFHFEFAGEQLPAGSSPYDWAGFLIDEIFILLADRDGQSGDPQFQVLAGRPFGFRVVTEDNTGEPGILTISGFTAPEPTGVPEPGAWTMLAGAGVVYLAFTLHRRRRKGGHTQ